MPPVNSEAALQRAQERLAELLDMVQIMSKLIHERVREATASEQGDKVMQALQNLSEQVTSIRRKAEAKMHEILSSLHNVYESRVPDDAKQKLSAAMESVRERVDAAMAEIAQACRGAARTLHAVSTTATAQSSQLLERARERGERLAPALRIDARRQEVADELGRVGEWAAKQVGSVQQQIGAARDRAAAAAAPAAERAGRVYDEQVEPRVAAAAGWVERLSPAAAAKAREAREAACGRPAAGRSVFANAGACSRLIAAVWLAMHAALLVAAAAAAALRNGGVPPPRALSPREAAANGTRKEPCAAPPASPPSPCRRRHAGD